MRRRVRLPSLCLTCGYGEVPGEVFNKHECAEFEKRPDTEQDENAKAHADEVRRRLR